MSGNEQPTDQNTRAIKIIMAVLDTDQKQLAQETGEDPAVISRVLTGQRAYKRARRQIAQALCRGVNQLLNVEVSS